MTAELTTHHSSTELSTQMDFARMVTSGGGQSILPDVYRNNPANVLIAVGLGQSMGLSPAESLYRISVIKGKPSAGAELIAANVRKAGHKLRVSGNETTCTATIVRADDPDYEFSVTRDLAWAKSMGLSSNDNYRKQPGTMLQWRAITAVARLACPEALYGVTYTPDEIAEQQPAQAAPAAKPQGMAALREAVAPVEADDTGEAITPATLKRLQAAFREAGFTESGDRHAFLTGGLGREVTSTKDITESEAQGAITELHRRMTEADGFLPVEGDQ